MDKKMKILLVSYYFAPQNTIAAVRTTKLAKYFSRMGHEVTVICGEGASGPQDPTLARDLGELTDVRILREWNLIRDRKQKSAARTELKSQSPSPSVSNPGWKGRKTALLNSLYLFLLFLSDCSFARCGLREIRQMGVTFDVVISSYGPLSSLRIGREVKRRGIAEKWIADFRDELRPPFGWMTGVCKRVKKQVQREADGITGVSQGVLEAIEATGKAKVFSNGFDCEDLDLMPPYVPAPSPVLHVAYCGQIYARKQSLTPFFKAVGRLFTERECSPGDIRVIYAGREGALIKAQAREAGVEEIVTDRGQITREKSLALQREADVLLMASWNLAGETGILTGKLLEYMMMGKPILCCVSGTLPGSELKMLIHGENMGFCFEEANAAEDAEKLYSFLRELLACKRAGNSPLIVKTGKEMGRYAYPEIAKAFLVWMEAMNP